MLLAVSALAIILRGVRSTVAVLSLLVLFLALALLLAVDDIVIDPGAVINVDIKVVHVLPIDRKGRQARHGTAKGGLGGQ